MEDMEERHNLECQGPRTL